MYNNQTAAGVRTFRTGQETQRLGRNFRAAEMKSRSGSTWRAHPNLIALLDEARDYFGFPVIITPQGGDRNDGPNHVGLAADCYVSVPENAPCRWPTITHAGKRRIEPETLAAFFDTLGAGGVGVYHTPYAHVHVDVRGSGRRWDSRASARKRARPFRFGAALLPGETVAVGSAAPLPPSEAVSRAEMEDGTARPFKLAGLGVLLGFAGVSLRKRYG